MGKGWQGAVLRGLGAKEHRVVVMAKRQLTANFVRVECHSETLLRSEGEAPGNWIRAWFPDPDGRSREWQRGYTLVDPDPATGRFSLDFVIHHPVGPGAYWASHCEPGDEIVAMRYGERPFQLVEPAPAGYLFLGDLASYPAIRALAESIPKDLPVEVVLERYSPVDDSVDPIQAENARVRWVDTRADSEALADAIRGQDWQGWYAWVSAESTATRRAKTLLQREHGLSRDQMHAQAYWVRGRAMGKSAAVQT